MYVCSPLQPRCRFRFVLACCDVCVSLACVQLRDSVLRRHVLLQFLIVIQLLTKGKRELFGPGALALTPAMAAELDTVRHRVLNCISQTPPDGAKFKDAIVHILHRETYWMKW